MSEYMISFNTISEDTSLPSFIRMLSSDMIKNNGYISVGKFFESLSDYEIAYLLEDLEEMNKLTEETIEGSHAGMNLTLLTMMLMQADGTFDINEDSIQKNLDVVSGFILVESLARKGLVKAFRENYSLSEIDLKIASAI